MLVDGARRETAASFVRRPPLAICLAITVAAEAGLLATRHLSSTRGIALAIVAAAAWGFVVSDPQLESRPRWVATAIVVAFAIAIAVPPRGSHDLWSYVMYGRTVGVHHASPYLHAPSAYPHDPFLHLVSSGWQGTRSVYGPLFTGLSAILTRLAGTSVLRARLAFQGLALVGVVASLGLVWKETRSVRSLAFVGLHPAVVTAIVNGGHNDGLVGLSVLAGAVLVGKRRVTAAGVAVGLGMLVKASTAFGILGIAVWLATRDRRSALRFLTVAALTTVAGYAFAGSAALRTVADAAGRTSRASVWSPISRVLPGAVGGAALLTVVVLALVGARRFRSESGPALAVAAAFAAYLVAGAYVLPWYPAWALPSAALVRRSWVAILVAAHAAFLVAAYELPRRVASGSLSALVRGIAFATVAFAVLAAFVAFLSRSHPAEPSRTPVVTAGE
jgi:hypothetical protein